MLSQKEIQEIEKERWQVNCQKIWLTDTSSGDDLDVYGPGTLSLDGDGVVRFKMHADGSMNQWFPRVKNRIPAGTIVDDTHYVDVNLRDWWGRTWKARHIDVQTDQSFCT